MPLSLSVTLLPVGYLYVNELERKFSKNVIVYHKLLCSDKQCCKAMNESSGK